MAYRICFVCSGNICRSPMAEAVLRHRLVRAGLEDQVRVDSAGTGDWHVGERADGRAVSTLHEHGYDGSTHRARIFDPAWFAERDLIVALDRGHQRELLNLATTDGERRKVRLLRGFADPAGGDLDVADPYYGGAGDFAEVLEQVEAACDGMVEQLIRSGVVVSA